MLSFVDKVMDFETFVDDNGECGFILNDIRWVLFEVKGFQYPQSLTPFFQLKLATGERSSDYLDRFKFFQYRDSTNVPFTVDDSIVDCDGRIWGVVEREMPIDASSSQSSILSN